MIKFGTGGWRAVIADEFTKENIRLLMAGLPQEKLIHWEDPHQAAAALEVEAPDTVFVLYDLYSVDLAKEVKGKLLQRMALLPPKEPQPGKEAAGHEN